MTADATPPPRAADVARQVATVVGAVAQAVLPAVLLPRVRRDLRPPEVAQPAAWAFTVWLPIYAAAAAVHAAQQARPALRSDPVLRDAGPPLAGAFLATGAWAPLVYGRRYRAAQAALAGTALLSGIARARVDRAPREAVPLSLALTTGSLAAWGAAACGVNLASLVVAEGVVPAGRPASAAGVATALALGGLGVATLPARAATPVQRAYGATLAWALVGSPSGGGRAPGRSPRPPRSPSCRSCGACADPAVRSPGVCSGRSRGLGHWVRSPPGGRTRSGPRRRAGGRAGDPDPSRRAPPVCAGDDSGGHAHR